MPEKPQPSTISLTAFIHGDLKILAIYSLNSLWLMFVFFTISRHNQQVSGKFTEPIERFDHVHIDIVRPLRF